MFSVQIARVRRLSPSFVRITFTGPDLDEMADNGLDQRLKLILPLAAHGLAHLPTGPDWYASWRLLPEEHRNPIRTYTVRHVRPARREVDVDLVLHGHDDGTVAGPAAQYALHAAPGDEAVLLGPDARFTGRHGGLEFRPPAGAELLVAADETGVPAAANIVAALPRDAVGRVLLEVPHPDDRFDLGAPPGVEVSWCPRQGAGHGSRLLRSVLTSGVPRGVSPVAAGRRTSPDLDGGLLWDVPEEQPAAPSAVPVPLYAWVAGESSTVRAIRRHLVTELGHDRSAVAFMGYWRMGRAEC
jgi:NADPH-dependent ferric siderophore reductase